MAVLAIILVVTSSTSKRSASTQSARASLNARLGEVLGGAGWIHDQGSIDVLRVSDPGQLSGVWNAVRTRMVDVEGNIAGLAGSVSDPAMHQSLAYLGQSVAALRAAIESNVGVRLDPGAADQQYLVQTSTQSVYDRRQQLQAAISAVYGTQR